ncbi:helix-turn-helix transcriptional regulator [Oceaniglobus roseus]|uniref:helix-turn-helix transcriptional regulator n=1 Tax=Oceaniglobus roseus TaxID=1737570 RepID=UPI000C7EF67B|nr:WYL domain-containing protein [Kandeliimicrobium roseum]
MARSDRLLLLLQALRSLPGPVTAARLAAETEVSERTLYRDIEALRRAGAGIEGAAGYGYTLTEDPGLPPQSFSRIEIEALVMGLGEVTYRGDPELVAAAEAALSKIVASLTERQQRQAAHAVVRVHRYGRPPVATVDLSLLRRACWEEEALDIGYRDAEGTETRRRIWPLAITYLEDTTVLLAWCCLREGFRKFRIERICGAALAGASFRPRRVGLLREYVALMRAGKG